MKHLRHPVTFFVLAFLAIGPVFGAASRIDPNDVYQVSTPAAWERSQGLVDDTVAVELAFEHGTQPGDMSGQSSPVIYTDDEIVLLSESRVVSLDAETLAVNWDIDLSIWITISNRSSVLHGLTGPESRHIVLNGERYATFINLETGREEWTRELPYYGSSTWIRELAEGLLVHEMRGFGGEFISEIIDARTGEVVYTVPNSGDVRNWSVADDLVVIRASTEIAALSLPSGEVEWTRPTTDEVNVVLAQTAVLTITGDELVALDPATGQEMWMLFIRPNHEATGVSEGILSLVYGDEVHTVDIETGLLLQIMPANQLLYQLNDWVLLLDDDGLTMRNARTGAAMWNIPGITEVVDYYRHTDVLVVQLPPTDMLVIDSDSGERVSPDAFSSQSWIGDTTLYGHTESEAMAIDGDSGEVVWTHTATEPIEAVTPTGVTAVVITATTITWLEAETGELMQESDRLANWTDMKPAGDLLLIQLDDQLIIRDVVGGQEWIAGRSSIDDVSISSRGTYTLVQTDDLMWVYDNATDTMLWAEESADASNLSADGFVLIYKNWPNGKVYQLLSPEGTVVWEYTSRHTFGGFFRDERTGMYVIYFENQAIPPSIAIIDDATGEAVIESDWTGEFGLWNLRFGEGRVFVPGWTTSVLYRTEPVGPEQLQAETILRGAPSATAIERGTFPAGSEVTRTGNARETNGVQWIEVHIEGTPGWIRESELSAGESQATPTVSDVEILQVETVLRGAPNDSAVERGTFAPGTEVVRTGNSTLNNGDSWIEVTLDGTPGWIPEANAGFEIPAGMNATPEAATPAP